MSSAHRASSRGFPARRRSACRLRVIRDGALVLALAAPMARARTPGDVPSRWAPVIATSIIVPPGDTVAALCTSPDCALRHVRASSTVRLSGEFGRFTGRVTRWGADSLAGFDADPDWGGSVPAGAVGWPQVMRVEKRGSNEGKGAVWGALLLGSVTALIAGTAEVAASAPFGFFGGSSNAQHDIDRAALKGALIGGIVGAGIGAAIGAGSHHWVLVYVRR